MFRDSMEQFLLTHKILQQRFKLLIHELCRIFYSFLFLHLVNLFCFDRMIYCNIFCIFFPLIYKLYLILQFMFFAALCCVFLDGMRLRSFGIMSALKHFLIKIMWLVNLVLFLVALVSQWSNLLFYGPDD